jgi:hypothetical protein
LPTVIVTGFVFVPPRPSLTVSDAVYVPFSAYVCCGFACVETVELSPKFQL